MSAIDYILIVVIAVALHHAIGFVVKNKGKGCGGDCKGCQQSCQKREDE